MAKYRQRVLTSLKTQENPVYQWVQASSQNELNDLIVKTYIKSGRIWEFVESTATAPTNEGTTFAAYVETWLSLYKVNTLKPTTLRGYRTMLTAHLLPTFGNCNMHDIKPADVQTFLNEHKYLARSYLTYAAGLGTDLKTLQSIAGHADIQTTMNRYVHKQNDKIIETGNRLQNLFSDSFVQIPCTQEKPANAYGISI